MSLQSFLAQGLWLTGHLEGDGWQVIWAGGEEGEEATWPLDLFPPYNSSQNSELHHADRRKGRTSTKNEEGADEIEGVRGKDEGIEYLQH